MPVRSAILAAAFAAVLAAPSPAQEVVKLRSGKTLSGAIVFEGDSKTGFTLKRWDTGGSVFILWSQLPDSEAARIRARGAGGDGAATGGEVIDAVRILTSSREVTGIIASSDGDTITLKNRDGQQKIPKSAITEQTAVKVREAEIYNVDEMIARRAPAADKMGDYAKLVEVGNYARSLGAYAAAKDWYTKASGVADQTKQGEIKFLLDGIEAEIREDAAVKALAQIWKLAGELKYDEALAEANKFLTEYAESETGKANQNLLAALEAKKKEFIANRDKVLGEAVPELWRNARTALIAELSSQKEFAKAEEGTRKLDESIAAKVAEKLKCTADEATRFWDARTEKKLRTVRMEDGTWIFKGGQDGGMDYSGDPTQGSGEMEDIKRRLPGQDPKKPPKQYGEKLQTRQEWWDAASGLKRRDFLEGLYAMNSTHVKREPDQGEEKDCTRCRGQGKVKVMRHGVAFEAMCKTCHDTKKFLTVKYW